MLWKTLRRSTPLLLCALLLAPLLVAPPAEATGGRNYALLFGTGAYAQWPDLTNPVPDVRALSQVLSSRFGFLADVVENPDREQVIAQLRRYVNMDFSPGDQLVIVFAGHGTYDEVTDIGYLAAGDSASRRRDPNFVSLLSYPWILALIDQIPAPRILMVVDACYSGSLATGGKAGGEEGESASRWFVTSGGKEYVPDGDPDRHTPFVRALLGALEGVPVGEAREVSALVESFAGEVVPRPRWGRFGRDAGGTGLIFRAAAATTRGDGAASRPARPAAQETVALASSKVASEGAAEPEPLLRARPMRLSTGRLRQAFKRHGLYDATWNPEGDFANQFRIQERSAWSLISDLEAGLMWQQLGSDRRMTRSQAEGYVQTLNRSGHAGFSDWRLPTLEELGSLLEPQRQGSQGLFLHPLFQGEQETCWSADHDSEGQPYFISFNAGRAVLGYDDKTAFVRAVRTL